MYIRLHQVHFKLILYGLLNCGDENKGDNF